MISSSMLSLKNCINASAVSAPGIVLNGAHELIISQHVLHEMPLADRGWFGPQFRSRLMISKAF